MAARTPAGLADRVSSPATVATDVVQAADLASEPISGRTATAGERTTFERPYAPSWVDVLLASIERLPGPTWLAYVLLGVVGVAVSVAGPASSGMDDPVVLASQAFWGVFLPLTLLLMHGLSQVAESAFDTFRPALTTDEATAARLRYELTVAPARPAAIVLIASAVFTPLWYVLDPESAAVVGLSPLGLALRGLSEIFFGALIFVLVLQSIRQLRRVAAIHDGATRVDLFRPAPLYAFSVLTSRTAIVLALVFLLPLPATWAQLQSEVSALVILPYVIGGVLVAVAVFVLPLRGMQRRIVAEKRRLQTEVGLRVEATMTAIHQAVDEGDYATAGSTNGALSALITERDLVDKLPTLPWRPGTLGALVSAIVLPLGLFLVERALSQLI
jgi:hypothetical protein